MASEGTTLCRSFASYGVATLALPQPFIGRPVQKLDRIEKSVVCEPKSSECESSLSQVSDCKLNIFYATGIGAD